MPTIKEIADAIEQSAPKEYAESWDNPGFQVGFPEKDVTKILLSLDFSEAVLEEAIAKKANMIVNHHPYIFHPIKNIVSTEYNTHLIIKAIKNDISIYAAHTNLDNVRDGLNFAVAGELGLNDIEFLEQTTENSGSGVTGTFGTPMDETDFLHFVKDKLQIGAMRYSHPTDKKIQRVSICTGAGAFLCNKALEIGSDAFITGDVRHHEFYIPDNKMLLIDAGHYETEQFSRRWFMETIRKRFPNVPVEYAESGVNPIGFLH
ncbi:MAG: Nif3-like dinuclear metal center hexameric protein [Bacteroidales bacterium]|nr:Nif3-like dinuclear metal center hexameric protein [Bacteroidales bacterium]